MLRLFLEAALDPDQKPTSPEAVAPAMLKPDEVNRTTSSGEVSVNFEEDAPEVTAAAVDSSATAALSNGGGSETSGESVLSFFFFGELSI